MQGAGGVGGRGQGARLSKVPNANDESGTLCASVCVCVCVGGKQSKHNDNDRFANICHVYEQNKGAHTHTDRGTHTHTHRHTLAAIGTRITQYRT